MKAYLFLAVLGAALIAGAAALGGRAAAFGGVIAVVAQLWAVSLLRPVMGARTPQPAFMGRWLGSMVIRFVLLGALFAWSVTHRATLPPVATMLGFVGVLLPLLFLEIRFLR